MGGLSLDHANRMIGAALPHGVSVGAKPLVQGVAVSHPGPLVPVAGAALLLAAGIAAIGSAAETSRAEPGALAGAHEHLALAPQ